MIRILFVPALLSLMVVVAGCAMCQDCQDKLGPVPESPNYSTTEHGDRSGSVLSGGISGPIETVAEGPTPADDPDQDDETTR